MSAPQNVCPKCASTEVGGLMEAFWVSIDEVGQPKGQWNDWESDTELGAKRNCGTCGHEWETE